MASEVASPAASPVPVDPAPRAALPDRPAVQLPDVRPPEVLAAAADEPSGEGGALESVPRRRVRDRLARRIVAGQRSTVVRPVLEPLAALHRISHPKADLALLQRAYDVAEAAHASQKRKSGDPYITHPLAVATVLAGLGMDTTTLVAALLHDTVEDTGVALDTITADFGPEVAHLVDGVTKIDKVQLRGRCAGRDDPQDDRGHGPGPPGAGDQAGRPAAQHAHAALPPAGEAGEEGPRDAGDPRPAGPPAGHEHDQVGARGPRVRHACTPSATTRSCGWSPSGRRPGTPTWRR